MVTKALRVSVPILLVSLLLVGATTLGAVVNKDRDWQIIQKRLCECQADEPIAGPMVKDGPKAGGDLIWWFQGIENVECVSRFVDVDGDALPDVLLETYDSGAPQQDHFYCIKGNSPGYGTVLWSCRPPGGPSNSGGYGDQCVSYTGDVNGDGHDDALLGTAWGGRTAYAIDGQNGGMIWSYDTYAQPPYLSGWIYSICPIQDLNEDDLPDVLFGAGSDADAAFCVDGTDGSVIWKFQANDAVFSVAQIPDVNGDGKNDALIGTGDPYEDRFLCVSGASTGAASILWQVHLGASVHTVAAIEDVNGDGKQDALAGAWDGKVYCRSGKNGAHIWSYLVSASDYIMRVVPIDDIDDDGIQDVLIGSWANAVICVSGVDGSLICRYTVGTLNGGDVWSVDAIGDVNGDGYPEALGGSFDYKVYCVDLRACDTLWTYYTGNRLYTVRGLPDVSGDGTPDALAGTQMLSGQPGGKAYCISGGLPLDTVPNVVATYPTQNQLNVATDTDISVTFDVNMDQTTIDNSTFVINSWSTGLHQGTITYDGGTKTATLNPSEDFEEGELVIVVLTTGIESSWGAPLENSYVCSFTTAVNGGYASFSSPVGYGAGEGPISVFCGDLDGDDDLDLVAADWGDTLVSVLKNNGDGTFQPKVDYAVGEEPLSVFCADLDGDGSVDLAVASAYDDNVSILKNNGDGTFQTKADYDAGDAPVSLFCADLDGDGDLDLAVANFGNDSASILSNSGDGTFQPGVSYAVGDEPVSVFCADMDGDGDLDLVVANKNSDDVSILDNNGDGTFQTKVDYTAGDAPASVFCADLDGDGDLDLVLANQFGDNLSILKNNGDGTFQAKEDYVAGNGPLSVFCADLDGDTDLDLVAANEYSNDVSILRNNGNGTFQAKTDYEAGDIPFSVFSADLDGDADMDLAVANNIGSNVSILLNCLATGNCNGDEVTDVGDAIYLLNYLFKGGSAPNPLGVGDVNCDDVVDLGDVIYLLNYMFKGGEPPRCC